MFTSTVVLPNDDNIDCIVSCRRFTRTKFNATAKRTAHANTINRTLKYYPNFK